MISGIPVIHSLAHVQINLNMKTNTKSGLFFGIIMTMFFIIGPFFEIDYISTTSVYKIILTGVIRGVGAGFIFGWVMGKVISSK
jgi:hypothetical protein